MDETNDAPPPPRGGRRFGTQEAEELVLRTISAHAESLLRTARRHSLCHDDAQDAYQRALEIFMRNAERLDPGRAAAWLHVVCKHEAMAVRKSRQQLVAVEDVDLDAHEAPHLPTPDERLHSFDMLARSAEALQRLKPQELRALWLKAEGHSYSDIAETTGWTYTKVNRCLTEGRKAFLERYAGIESGEECERWGPTLSAIVDGEATTEQIVALRPHLRNCSACRATLKALRDSGPDIAAVLPVPLLGGVIHEADAASSLLVRVYEGVVGGLYERAATSAVKVQTAFEAATSGKVAAVAASAAAVAGGGYATVDRTTIPVEPDRRPAKVSSPRADVSAPAFPVSGAPAPVPPAAAPEPSSGSGGTPPPTASRKEAAVGRSSGSESPEATFGFEGDTTSEPAPQPAATPAAHSAPAPFPPPASPAPQPSSSSDYVPGSEFGP